MPILLKHPSRPPRRPLKPSTIFPRVLAIASPAAKILTGLSPRPPRSTLSGPGIWRINASTTSSTSNRYITRCCLGATASGRPGMTTALARVIVAIVVTQPRATITGRVINITTGTNTAGTVARTQLRIQPSPRQDPPPQRQDLPPQRRPHRQPPRQTRRVRDLWPWGFKWGSFRSFL